MRTVLVAEDDASLRAFLTEALEEAGYRSLPCENGASAWDRLLEGGVDLAILDLNMPVLDGLELVRRVRGHQRLKDTPVLMLTIRDLLDDQVSGYEGGADDYLTKPFDADLLVAHLKVLERRLLDRPRPASS